MLRKLLQSYLIMSADSSNPRIQNIFQQFGQLYSNFRIHFRDALGQLPPFAFPPVWQSVCLNVNLFRLNVRSHAMTVQVESLASRVSSP